MNSLTINLHGILHKTFSYPAGESQVRILRQYVDLIKRATEIRIVAPIKNGEDIIELALLADSLEGMNEARWTSIILPYLPYGRADRRFTEGDCFGLKVFGQILASMAPSRIVTLDAHSDQAFKYIPELVNIPATSFVERAVMKFAEKRMAEKVCVLFPDDGARKRYTLPVTLGCNFSSVEIKILNASKARDVTSGEFLGFRVPDPDEFEDLPTLIVDDICDGGGTFIGLGELIPRGIDLGLFVNHGIFSKGIRPLRDRFTWIGTTNTFYPGSFSEDSVADVPDYLCDALASLLEAGASTWAGESGE